MIPGGDGPQRWADASLAAACLAVDPVGLGGAVVRASSGAVRDAWLGRLRQWLPAAAPWRRLPAHAADGRLLGGLDLAATLRAGRPVAERGLLAEVDGGVLVAPMAERLTAGTAALITTALDTGEVALERDGLGLRFPTRFAVVALDEGDAPEEAAPAALCDRLAFGLDLGSLRAAETDAEYFAATDVASARSQAARVRIADEIVASLCAAGHALGIDSMRAVLFAVRAARVVAALDGRDHVSPDDATAAGRLVFAHRATQLPVEEPPQPPEEAPPPSAESTPPDEEQDRATEILEDRVVASVAAVLPPDVLAGLLRPSQSRARAPLTGRSGATRQGRLRGRPAGVRKGMPRAGVRLNVVETLRAAAPWQRLRHAQSSREADARPGRVAVRPDDFRVTRFRHRTPTTTVFVVDASGSTALHRLGEAKGAVELLLADCYVRRDRVALIAFRGESAELLLPPTRSLVRAKRCLAGLPGGGGTPLATGIDAAVALADALRHHGDTPLLVFLSDGGANVARDGAHGRQRAQDDAQAAAVRVRTDGLAAVVVDTSPRPSPLARQLAEAMQARYLPLPRADAATLSRAVGAGVAGGRRAGAA
jgi:magnesium chelatase subunit D